MQTQVELPKITAKTAPAFAKQLWGAVSGDNFAQRNEALTTLFGELRKARDADKTTKKRTVKTATDVISSMIGKSLGDMQQAYVEVQGIRFSLPQLFKTAENAESPMNASVKAFIAEHKIALHEKKDGSQGRAKSILVRLDSRGRAMKPKEATSN